MRSRGGEAKVVQENRFRMAMTMFAVLGLLAWFTLDGNFRYFTLAVLGLFAMRTMIYDRRRQLEERLDEKIEGEQSREESGFAGRE